METLKEYTYQPVRFFVLTFLLTWVSWFISAYFSFRADGQSLFVLFMIPGLIAPFVVALWMILTSKDPALKAQFTGRLFNLRLIRISSVPAILVIMPFAVIVSIGVSLLFGQSIDQLQLSGGFSFSAGFLPVLLILFLAASFEELGWRSYAMDSLLMNRTYFTATLIFSVLWALWHLPLFFIKDYYQYNLLQTNMLYAVNFMVSIIPMGFIISWICRINRGSILAAILFHFVINMSQEMFEITQITKCIETIVLMLIAVVIVWSNRDMFFTSPARD